MPFVQGHLRQERLAVAFKTECGHCARPLHIDIDSELNVSVAEEDADPLAFVPIVNFAKLRAKNIIDDF